MQQFAKNIDKIKKVMSSKAKEHRLKMAAPIREVEAQLGFLLI
jgi:hypothetical protein